MAKGLWTWCNDTYQKAVSLWFADNTGSYKEAKAAWVRANGAWQKYWPVSGSVTTTAKAIANTATTPYWSALKIDWIAKYATNATVVDVTSGTTLTKITYTGADQDYVASTYTASVLPNTTKTYRVDIVDQDGVIYSGQASAKTPNVDTPAGFTAKQSGLYGATTAGKYTYALAWTAVTGATGYRIKTVIDGVAQPDKEQSSTTLNYDLPPGKSYSFTLQAYWLKDSVKYYSATTSQSGTTTSISGTYYYKPTANATWQTGTGGSGDAAAKWRTDYLVHGKAPSAAGSTAVGRGTQTAIFFTYKNKSTNATPSADLSSLQNAITSAYIYVGRSKSTLNAGETTCYFVTHTNASKPTGAPTYKNTGITASANPKTLASGEYDWIPIPVAYAKQLAAGTISGFGWGYTTNTSLYMVGPECPNNLTATTPAGTIKIITGTG